MNKQEIKKLEKEIKEILNNHFKSIKTPIVIAGISGGTDSIFLLHFLKQTNAKIIIAHINHKLRGENSDLDEKFVKNISENLIFHSKKINIKEISKKKKTGIEETARKIRYKFFQDLAKKYKANYIITAHHADDNIETILLNLTRGTGIQGIQGIQEKGEILNLKSNNKENKFIFLRPLLQFSKKEILEYLKHKKIKYKEDKTNKDTTYNRNFIRHEIIPKLKKINPSLIETFAKNQKNIKEINEYLKLQAQKWIKNNKNSDFSFNATSFRKQHTAIQKIILREIYLKHVGNLNNLENIHITEALKVINNNIGNKEKKLGKTNIYIKNNIFYIILKNMQK